MSAARASFAIPVLLLLLAPAACRGDSAAEPKAADSNRADPKASPFVPPVARSANERVNERRGMVFRTMEHPRDGRKPVTDRRVLEAMRAVPRHAFLPDRVRHRAYSDMALPIGHDQTMSQPYIVALMTEHLKLTPDTKVLEVGTGSGYQAAVLAQLTPHVWSIEIVEPLAERAAKTLKDQGYASVEVKAGDGYKGWPEHAPFDAIIVTCAPDELPAPLWDQLAPGGRIVIPVGPTDRIQQLVVISKTPDGERRTQTITEVRFVPMTRGER